MSIRVLLCVVVESVAILLVNLYILGRGWTMLCGEQCGETEVWIAYTIGAGLATTLAGVYVIGSLFLGRTPLMGLLRVPSMWQTIRAAGLANASATRRRPPRG